MEASVGKDTIDVVGSESVVDNVGEFKSFSFATSSVLTEKIPEKVLLQTVPRYADIPTNVTSYRGGVPGANSREVNTKLSSLYSKNVVNPIEIDDKNDPDDKVDDKMIENDDSKKVGINLSSKFEVEKTNRKRNVSVTQRHLPENFVYTESVDQSGEPIHF